MRKFAVAALGSLIAAFFAGFAGAHEFSTGSLTIDHPWSRATPPSAKVGGGYFTISNTGAEPDTLVSASSDIAERLEFHIMSMDGDVMKMKPVTGPLVIGPGQKLVFEPGGLHLMMFGLKAGLKEGEKFSGTLNFEKAGSVQIAFDVDRLGAKAPSANPAAGGANGGAGMTHGSN